MGAAKKERDSPDPGQEQSVASKVGLQKADRASTRTHTRTMYKSRQMASDIGCKPPLMLYRECMPCLMGCVTCAPAQDSRTVFVKGVAFGIEQQAFEEAFSDVGPVQRCFLVRDKGAAKHKGVGFVQYAVPEDAQRVVQELNGKVLGGRKLQVRG